MSDTMVWAMLGIIVAQQAFWSFQVHRLVDKLMSRTYYDYETARTLGDPKPQLQGVEDMVEDLSGLNGFRQPF